MDCQAIAYHHASVTSVFRTSPCMSRLVAAAPPNRVRHPTDRHFASGCSPPRLAATQLPSASESVASSDTDFHRADVAPSWAHSFRRRPVSRRSAAGPVVRRWMPVVTGMTNTQYSHLASVRKTPVLTTPLPAPQAPVPHCAPVWDWCGCCNHSACPPTTASSHRAARRARAA